LTNAAHCRRWLRRAESLASGRAPVIRIVLNGAGVPVLEPMTDADYEAFVVATVPAYAAEKVSSGQWAREQSLALARAALAELLPRGRHTPDHYMFNVLDDHARPVGTLWFAAREQAGKRIAYVYDVHIRPDCRRKGHARGALEAAESEARRLGLSGIGLHVFGHNSAARALYEKLGYQTTNVNMYKPL
jgi:ribosomal protein S18 acetylase RimI-like enzyme